MPELPGQDEREDMIATDQISVRTCPVNINGQLKKEQISKIMGVSKCLIFLLKFLTTSWVRFVNL